MPAARNKSAAKSWPADRVESWPIDRLKPYERNARTHSDAQIEQIAESIKEWGWTVPVLSTKEGRIIAGHGRVEAARRLGLAAVPVMVADGWTDAQVRAYTLADNQLATKSGWDGELLKQELSGLEALGFDLELAGFSPDDLSDIFGAAGQPGKTDPDAVPDLQPGVSEPGDIWQCGVHKVAMGDSTSLADVERLMDGLLADACWTDPPYNVDYKSKAGKIKNDNLEDGKFRAFLTDALVGAYATMKPGAPIYVAHADTEGLNFRAAFAEAGFRISGCLIWAKDSLVLGRSDYQWQHEPILYGWKPGAAHRWFGGRKQTTLIEVGGSVFTENEDGTVTVKIGSESIIISGQNLSATAVEPTLIRCEKPKRSAEHPTMKPVQLISKMLLNSSRAGDIVLDLFGGSGSTLIACEMHGRQARLIELDALFVDLIVRRWQDFTGRVATLVGDGRTFEEVKSERQKADPDAAAPGDRQPAEAPSTKARSKGRARRADTAAVSQ